MDIKKLRLKHPQLTTSQWWLLSLSVAFVLTALLAAHAAFLFVRALNTDAVIGGAGGGTESISREALSETIRAFEVRIRRFESIMTSYDAVDDPSL
jgi:hypothetical protein